MHKTSRFRLALFLIVLSGCTQAEPERSLAVEKNSEELAAKDKQSSAVSLALFE